jgi:DNA-binding response OmpR family regulator
MSVVETHFATAVTSGTVGSPVKVLIVDDDRKLREVLVEQFLSLGIVPLEASAGYSAIQLAGAHRPDLIILDGLLPEMHGLEVARFIRNLDPGYRPHITMVTGVYKNVRYHNEARLRYGVDDYLSKPASMEALAAIVTTVTQEVH